MTLSVLLLSLNSELPEFSARALEEMGIETAAYEITLSEGEKEKALSRFKRLMEKQKSITGDTETSIMKLLAIVQGTGKVIEILNHITAPMQQEPLDFIRKMNPEHFLRILTDEEPEDIAIVLSRMDPGKAAAVLSLLPAAIRPRVIARIADMDETKPSGIMALDGRLRKRLTSAADEIPQIYPVPAGGIYAAVEILNCIDRSIEAEIIEILKNDDPGMAEEIRKLIIVFSDIAIFDKQSLKLILKSTDLSTLAMALKGADAETHERIFAVLEESDMAQLKQEMERMGPVRLADVEASQQLVINKVRELEESGEIIVARNEEEDLIT